MIPNGQQAAHYRDDVIASLLVTVHDWMITTDMFKILIKMHFYLLLSTYAFFFFFNQVPYSSVSHLLYLAATHPKFHKPLDHSASVSQHRGTGYFEISGCNLLLL